MADDPKTIKHCAKVVDEHVKKLEGIRKGSRKGHYDRHAPLQIDYAIRRLKLAATAIRALVPMASASIAIAESETCDAITLLKELRPVVEQTRRSQWRSDTLARIDAAISG